MLRKTILSQSCFQSPLVSLDISKDNSSLDITTLIIRYLLRLLSSLHFAKKSFSSWFAFIPVCVDILIVVNLILYYCTGWFHLPWLIYQNTIYVCSIFDFVLDYARLIPISDDFLIDMFTISQLLFLLDGRVVIRCNDREKVTCFTKAKPFK